MGPKKAHGYTQNVENHFDFDFLELYQKVGNKLLNHIMRVTCDETRVSFLNAETIEQSKQWIHTQDEKV
jgi:hypothetical protein